MTASLRPTRIAAIVIAIASAAALALACKQGPPAPSCPASFKDLTADQQNAASASFDCTCAPNAVGGSIWGSGIYTTDSNICAAAIHAGASTSAGGLVTLKKAPGCPAYTGSAANGMTTDSWGPFDSSFYFSGKGSGSCSSASAAGSANGAPKMKN